MRPKLPLSSIRVLKNTNQGYSGDKAKLEKSRSDHYKQNLGKVLINNIYFGYL